MKRRFTARQLRRTTDRLVVRPLAAADLAAWSASRAGVTPASFRSLLAVQRRARALDRNYSFAVFERDGGAEGPASGPVVGDLYLYTSMRWTSQIATLGYGIAEDRRRRGYATEAVGAALELAFGVLGFHRVEAEIRPSNAASIALARRLGFRHEATFPASKFEDGAWQDMAVFALHAEDLGHVDVRPAIGLSLAENV